MFILGPAKQLDEKIKNFLTFKTVPLKAFFGKICDYSQSLFKKKRICDYYHFISAGAV